MSHFRSPYLVLLLVGGVALASMHGACGGAEPISARRDAGAGGRGPDGSFTGQGGAFTGQGGAFTGQGGMILIPDAGAGGSGAGGRVDAGAGGSGTGGRVDAGAGGAGTGGRAGAGGSGAGGRVDAGAGGSGAGGRVDAGAGGAGAGGRVDAGAGGSGAGGRVDAGAGGAGMGGSGAGGRPDAGGANCVANIRLGGYAFSPAAPCSACRDNQVLLETKCMMMLDCIEPMWPCTGCFTQCLNQVGGSGVLDGCVRALTTAACGM